ncbi:MAG: tRNA (adenosine(37)-N6)-dimethylallyltransferase MiaA [Acidobacteriota bacterium]
MKSALIVVVGPTASGKSALALHLARALPVEIVSCDSLQIYRHLDIGTAKPTPEERGKVLHHMIDVREPDGLFTAGDYMAEGREVLDTIRRRSRVPIVVGGTGLYLRALLEGLFDGPKRSESLRARLNGIAQSKGPSHLHHLLSRVDPPSATRIAPNDKPKLIRALEVYFLTSRSISTHFSQGRSPLLGFASLKIGLLPPRQLLYEQIDRRVDQMFESGLVDEVRSLLAKGYASHLKPFQSLGYSQVVQHLLEDLPLSEAKSLAKRDTRRYAKRQLTWFRKEKDVWWLPGFGFDPSIQKEVSEKVTRFVAEVEGRQAPASPDRSGSGDLSWDRIRE